MCGAGRETRAVQCCLSVGKRREPINGEILVSKFTGTVEKIFDKTIATKRGKRQVFSVKIDGNDAWFGAGFDKPSVVEGDYVQFEGSQNEKGFWDIKGDIIKIERPASAAKPAASPGSGESVTSYEKEIRYNYRFAYATAQELATTLAAQGLLPTSGKAAKKAVSYDDIAQFIDEQADRIFARCWNVEGLEAILEAQASGVDDAVDVTPGPGGEDSGD